LRDARAVADHSLGEAVREGEPVVGPGLAGAQVAVREHRSERRPPGERQRRDPPPRAHRQDSARRDQIDDCERRSEPARDRQRLKRVRLEDAAQELPCALAAHLFGRELEDAVKEPALEERGAFDGDFSLRAQLHESERNLRHEEGRPGKEPPSVEAPAERALADAPPRRKAERVLAEVRGDEDGHVGERAGVA
jgi:hypothetical protein